MRNKSNPPKANRQRKIIWFNPPCSANVNTNIAKKFLQLIDTHFPKKNRLHKIFNRNNVKVSYSSLPNIASIINSHNKYILNNSKENITPTSCNCKEKSSCPVNGNCQQSSII